MPEGHRASGAEQELRSPLDRTTVVLDQASGPFNEDLAWILRQYKDRTGAAGVSVRLEHFDGRPSEQVFHEGETSVSGDDRLTTFKVDPGHAAGLRIVQADAGVQSGASPWQALSFDLAQNESSRVVIEAIYPAADDAAVADKQEVARRLHPVLAGYFKLWLLQRSTSRRLESIIAALTYTEHSIIILDRNAMIVFENPAAARILDEGRALHRCRGSICATDRSASVRLRLEVEQVLAGRRDEEEDEAGHPVVLVKTPGKEAPLVVALTPVDHPGRASDDPAVVIHLFDPGGSVDEMIAPICAWFSLSPAETRLVRMLVAGQSVAEMGRQEGIKPDTVRTYLKNAFRKTGTKSQADLVRLMMTNPIRLRQRG